MRPIQIFFLLVFSITSTLALAETVAAGADNTMEAEASPDVVPLPVFAIKLRGLPLLSTLASTLNAGRFNHSVMVDLEAFVSPGFSVGLAVGHSRLTIGGDSVLEGPVNGDRLDYFIRETQIGLLLTHYTNGDLTPSSFYLRAHGFAVLPETDSSPAGNGVIPINQGRDSFGFRTGLEVGWVFRHQNVVFDMGAGFSAHVANPYTKFTDTNEHGVPAGVSNAFFGISDVYPTLNFSLGILL